MKAPLLKDLGKIKPEDNFSQAVQAEAKKASRIVKASFSLEKAHVDYINQVALKLSNECGKPVKASAALRFIINRDMEVNT